MNMASTYGSLFLGLRDSRFLCWSVFFFLDRIGWSKSHHNSLCFEWEAPPNNPDKSSDPRSFL